MRPEKTSGSSLRSLLLAGAVLGGIGLMAGCPAAKIDLGTQCFLVKKNPDGGDPLRIKESELSAGRDFVSFGAVECENFVCVRDKDAPPTGADGGDPDALGYCTKDCSPATPITSCTPSPGTAQFDPVPANGAPRTLSCQAMILDEVTIAQFCNAQPAKCQELFGPNRSPYFCSRGTPSASDGGTSTDGGM